MNPYPLRKELAEEYNRRFFVGAYVEVTVKISELKAHIDEAYRTGVTTEYLYERQAELDRLKTQAVDYADKAEFFGGNVRGLKITNV
jgi:sulfite reductase alpha subunit-like flavoprotein